MGGNNGLLRALLSVVLLVGFLWFLFAGVLDNQAKLTEAVQSTGSSELSKPHGKEWHVVSKRRVPNGPDPIHNRRAGNARQPPDRA